MILGKLWRKNVERRLRSLENKTFVTIAADTENQWRSFKAVKSSTEHVMDYWWQQKIDTLEAEKHELKTELHSRRNFVDGLRAKIAALEMRGEGERTKISTAENEAKRLQNLVDELHENLLIKKNLVDEYQYHYARQTQPMPLMPFATQRLVYNLRALVGAAEPCGLRTDDITNAITEIRSHYKETL